MGRVINICNTAHLGDNLFSMVAFYHIKDFIEANDIYINYFCRVAYNKVTHNDNTEYHNQLSEFKCSDNILIHDLQFVYNNGTPCLNAWIGDTTKKFHLYNSRHLKFNEFLAVFFTQIFEMCQIPVKIDRFYYEDRDLLHRYENLSDSYKNIDILIVNSKPLSGQYELNDDIWNEYIKKLDTKYNIVTTRKVDGVKCTVDEKFTVKNIAAISTNIKVLIAVNTGVVVGLYNKYMLSNIKKAYIFDNNHGYSYKNFVNVNQITDISGKELADLIET